MKRVDAFTALFAAGGQRLTCHALLSVGISWQPGYCLSALCPSPCKARPSQNGLRGTVFQTGNPCARQFTHAQSHLRGRTHRHAPARTHAHLEPSACSGLDAMTPDTVAPADRARLACSVRELQRVICRPVVPKTCPHLPVGQKSVPKLNPASGSMDQNLRSPVV